MSSKNFLNSVDTLKNLVEYSRKTSKKALLITRSCHSMYFT